MITTIGRATGLDPALIGTKAATLAVLAAQPFPVPDTCRRARSPTPYGAAAPHRH